jgi:uncharacterized protein YdeI (YjbR/CyaY-like superfamily)
LAESLRAAYAAGALKTEVLARVMKFTGAKEIATKAATIKAYVHEAVAAEKAGMKVETKPRELPVPEELKRSSATIRGSSAPSRR